MEMIFHPGQQVRHPELGLGVVDRAGHVHRYDLETGKTDPQGIPFVLFRSGNVTLEVWGNDVLYGLEPA